jgi:tetratricopeptide (TPR) repeat protein
MLALGVVVGVQALRDQIAPAIAQARIKQAQAQLLTDANSLLEAGKLGSAELKFEELLSQVPDHSEAKQGLAQVAAQRELLSLYEQGVTQQQAGELRQALAVFQDLLVRAPQYKDVRLQVGEIQHTLKVEELFALAEAAYADERYEEALDLYEQLQALDSSYQAGTVKERLFALYMNVGRALVEQRPPQTELLPAAIDYFGRALSLQPRSADAAWEQRLAEAFLDGMVRYQEGYFDQAIISLRAVYDRRPDYMGSMTLNLLYESYVRSGDQYRRENDLGFAYEQYRQASALPVEDRTLALERLREIIPFLTPTPTPTTTPTPTATPIPTATRPPTAVPTPKPLAAYRNHIAFWSDNEDRPGPLGDGPHLQEPRLPGRVAGAAEAVRRTGGQAARLPGWPLCPVRAQHWRIGADHDGAPTRSRIGQIAAPATYPPASLLSPCLVARWGAHRIRQRAGPHRRHLERRRLRTAQPDGECLGMGEAPLLVARWDQDHLLVEQGWPQAVVYHGCGWAQRAQYQ